MIVIIKATLKHSNLIVALGKQSFIESHGNSASVNDINNFISKVYSKKAIKKELNNTDFFYYIIYFKNKPAGFSKIEFNVANLNIEEINATKLDRIYLLQEFHDLGLGSKLFDFNISLARKNNQRGIWLATWIENRKAIKFYTIKGFKIVGKYDFKIAENHSNPNHIMYLEF